MLDYIDIAQLSGTSIIYDCMDDVAEFYSDESAKLIILEKEKELILNSKIIIVSSSNLKNKLEGRGANAPIHVINNAINISFPTEHFGSLKSRNTEYSLVYFGTISSWFDFDTVLSILDQHPDVRLVLVGPVETKIPKHSSIRYLGVIKHDDLHNLTQHADAFIMPFIVNELIQSVDPVKVYEYIALRKPAFVVEYEETKKFGEFVYLYNDIESLSNLISKLKEGSLALPSYPSVLQFLGGNTWDERVESIKKILKQMD